MSIPSWAVIWYEAGFRRVRDGGTWSKINPDNELRVEVRPMAAGYRVSVQTERNDPWTGNAGSLRKWKGPAWRVDTYASNEEAFAAYIGWTLTGILPEPELWPRRPR